MIVVAASVVMIAVNGLGAKRSHRQTLNQADVVFRHDAAVQKGDAAALVVRMPRTAPDALRARLATEAGTAAPRPADDESRATPVLVDVRRHFQDDRILARIEIASGSDRNELARARRLLDHGRGGIADVRAAN